MTETKILVEVDAEEILTFIRMADDNCLYTESEWTIREALWKKAVYAIARTRSQEPGRQG